MATIDLANGSITIVDDDDFGMLSQWKWKCQRVGYVCRTISGGGLLLMHRYLLGSPPDDVDHINGNRLDNRRENLRRATRSQNMHNRSKQKNNTSGLKGVSWDESRKLWKASIAVNKKQRTIGRYSSAALASAAYDAASMEMVGVFSRPNNHSPETSPGVDNRNKEPK